MKMQIDSEIFLRSRKITLKKSVTLLPKLRTFSGPGCGIRTHGLLVPNGSYCHFSRSSPLVFRPAVRCNAVVARYAEFLSGTVRKCVLRCPLSGCGCDCGSSFCVLLNVLREYRQMGKAENCSTPHRQLVRNSINKTKDNKFKPFGTCLEGRYRMAKAA